jgi:hypothetical protein
MIALLSILERMVKDKDLSPAARVLAEKMLKDLIDYRGLIKAGERKVS